MLSLKEFGGMLPRQFLKLHTLKLNLSALGVVFTIAVYIHIAILYLFVYNKYIFSPALHPGHIFLSK